MKRQLAFFALTLSLTLSCGVAAAKIAPTPHTATIVIHNNFTNESGLRIYPYLESAKRYDPPLGNPDLWMQAEFRTDTPLRQFLTDFNYRAYINPPQPGNPGGIGPGESVTITVPFYTQLKEYTDENLGEVHDQFIDWWNAQRVYFFVGQTDLSSALQYNGSRDPRPVTPLPQASAPKCPRDHCTILLKAYDISLKHNVPYGFAEYTFGTALDGPPPKIHRYDEVHYNANAVDSQYLPLAVGAYENPAVPYVGSPLTIEKFKMVFPGFSAQGEKWPFYIPIYLDKYKTHPGFPKLDNYMPCSLNAPFPDYPEYSLLPLLPSTFNVLEESYKGRPGAGTVPVPPLLSSQPPDWKTFFSNHHCIESSDPKYDTPNLGTYGQGMVDLWTKCTTSGGDGSPTCNDIQEVNDFFQRNYKAKCPAQTPDQPAVLKAVYGWVPIEWPVGGCVGNNLASTDGYSGANKAYCRLQYNYLTVSDPADIFNPWTGLIHSKTGLNSSAYAFSIDDALAVKNVTAKGIIIALGGLNGLENRNPTPIPQSEGEIGTACKGG
jgi:hypothetical protein